MLGRAFAHTAALWPEVAHGARWVREAAAILDNAEQDGAEAVTERYQAWLAQLEQESQQPAHSAPLRAAARHFLKVSRSYAPGLFHCYRIEGLPRTNNDLEHTFGSLRYHERRSSGRKVGSPSLVLQGCLRLPTALFTRRQLVTLDLLASVPVEHWRTRRNESRQRQQAYRLRYRFRKNPAAYLAALEADCSKLCLPS
jgi:hypothetical protein